METADPGGPARLTPPLPAGARLLHIGLPKTGTTALQTTAQARRADLLAAGVRYPGGGINHREAVSALMGRRWGWNGPGAVVPPRRHWDRLMTEVRAETRRRVWISHEFASEADDEAAARFVEELGEPIQVVVTLRPFAAVLVSSWQQYLKGGTTHTFERWLRAVLADPPEQKVTPSFHRRNDQAGVVRRWAAAAGAEHVTAVVVDKARPTQLTDAFEALLDLPPGFLVDSSLGGLQANRSMSLPESELMRQVNRAVKGQGVEWGDYEVLLREGGIARLLQARTPGARETLLQLPRWAADRASELGRRYADGIAASGVRVVGDLEVLARPAAGQDEPPARTASVPVDAAAAMVVGTLSAALGRGAFLADRAERDRRDRRLRDVRSAELVGEVATRLRRAAGRRLRPRG
ncbi:hypothetical protein GCM10009616_24170 [Microlunatus lacustris]